MIDFEEIKKKIGKPKIKNNQTKNTPEFYVTVYKLRLDGYSIDQIATVVGRSYSDVTVAVSLVNKVIEIAKCLLNNNIISTADLGIKND